MSMGFNKSSHGGMAKFLHRMDFLVDPFAGQITKNFAGIVACRIFIGLPESAFYPGAIYLLSRWYTKKVFANGVCKFDFLSLDVPRNWRFGPPFCMLGYSFRTLLAR